MEEKINVVLLGANEALLKKVADKVNSTRPVTVTYFTNLKSFIEHTMTNPRDLVGFGVSFPHKNATRFPKIFKMVLNTPVIAFGETEDAKTRKKLSTVQSEYKINGVLSANNLWIKIQNFIKDQQQQEEEQKKSAISGGQESSAQLISGGGKDTDAVAGSNMNQNLMQSLFNALENPDLDNDQGNIAYMGGEQNSTADQSKNDNNNQSDTNKQNISKSSSSQDSPVQTDDTKSQSNGLKKKPPQFDGGAFMSKDPNGPGLGIQTGESDSNSPKNAINGSVQNKTKQNKTNSDSNENSAYNPFSSDGSNDQSNNNNSTSSGNSKGFMNSNGVNDGMNQGGMNQGGMNQGGMNQSGMNQSGMKSSENAKSPQDNSGLGKNKSEDKPASNGNNKNKSKNDQKQDDTGQVKNSENQNDKSFEDKNKKDEDASDNRKNKKKKLVINPESQGSSDPSQEEKEDFGNIKLADDKELKAAAAKKEKENKKKQQEKALNALKISCQESLSSVYRSGEDKVGLPFETSINHCFIVELNEYQGLLLLATNEGVFFDEDRVKKFRVEVIENLKESGIKGSISDPIAINANLADYKDRAFDFTEFQTSYVSDTDDQQYVCFVKREAIRPAIEESEHKDMKLVSLKFIPPQTIVNFDAFIYLPINKKFVRYLKEGSCISLKQTKRHTEIAKGEAKFFIPSDHEKKFLKFHIQNTLNWEFELNKKQVA